MDDLLYLDQIALHYKNTHGVVKVLEDASLKISQGEQLSLMAPSGTGKSTLLQIAGLLMYPSSGEVWLDNIKTTSLSERDRDYLRAYFIGFIFQSHFLMNEFSALENITIPMQLTNHAKATSVKYAKKLLDRVGLSHRINHHPSQLSGGERQRVAVARALASRPKLLLADEPSGNLDEHHSKALIELLVEISTEEKMAILMVTHDQQMAGYMKTHLVLHQRRLIYANETQH
ncbi:MAG: ABC transporter ATP-binding protein [Pseudomonadota bacterium]